MEADVDCTLGVVEDCFSIEISKDSYLAIDRYQSIVVLLPPSLTPFYFLAMIEEIHNDWPFVPEVNLKELSTINFLTFFLFLFLALIN